MRTPAVVAVILASLTWLAHPAGAQAPADTLARIKAAKSISVAYAADSLPFAFVDKEAKPAGYAIDLCNKVIAGIGRAVGMPDLAIQWKRGTTAERLAMVADGRADLECGNTTPTLGRMRNVDFSALIFVDTGGLLVRRDAGIARVADLGGKRVAVIGGTTSEQRLAEVLKARLINAQVIRVRDTAEAIALIDSGGADAFASDKLKLVGSAMQAKDPKTLALLEENLSIEPYAFALPRNDSAFRLEVNRALSQVYSGGELQRIFARWFGEFGPPGPVLATMFLLNATQE